MSDRTRGLRKERCSLRRVSAPAITAGVAIFEDQMTVSQNIALAIVGLLFGVIIGAAMPAHSEAIEPVVLCEDLGL